MTLLVCYYLLFLFSRREEYRLPFGLQKENIEEKECPGDSSISEPGPIEWEKDPTAWKSLVVTHAISYIAFVLFIFPLTTYIFFLLDLLFRIITILPYVYKLLKAQDKIYRYGSNIIREPIVILITLAIHKYIFREQLDKDKYLVYAVVSWASGVTFQLVAEFLFDFFTILDRIKRIGKEVGACDSCESCKI